MPNAAPSLASVSPPIDGRARFLVGLSGSPFASRLLEVTHQLAIAANATWVAVFVETPYVLSPADQRQLDADLTDARELGADIVVTRDLEIADALLRVARDQHATHLVVGQSPSPRILGWRRLTLAEKLIRKASGLTIHVVPSDPRRAPRKRWRLAIEPGSHWGEYTAVVGVIAGITVAGLLLPAMSHVALGLIYLLAVIVMSLWLGRWPVLLAGVLSALVWEYVFIPPRFAIVIASAEDSLLFGTYFVVALVAGQLTARIRAQAENEHLREERATALLELSRILAEATSFEAAVSAALQQVEGLFGARTMLGLNAAPLKPHGAMGYALSATDVSAAEWAYRYVQHAGRFTRTLADAEAYYLPLRVERGAIGVLGVKLPATQTLSLGQRDLIEAFARQLALLAEREQLRAASEREKLLAASERLHRSLLDSVSHELRTPLAVIDAALDGLADSDQSGREKLAAEVRIAARRLNRLVRNLLDQTRLESGALKPRLDWVNAQDLVNAALDGTRDALADRPLELSIPDDLPPFRVDFALTEHALMNLVLNAAYHTPPGTAVRVAAGLDADGAFLAVADRGPGFPAQVRERLFRKFSRGDSARAGGLGLGLSIVRGLIQAQGGEVQVGDNPGGGAVVTIRLRHDTARNSLVHD